MTHEIMILYPIIFLAVGVIVLFLVGISIRSYKAKKKQEEKNVSPVGFVVDTFHDLVSQLKEKERELEVLRRQAEDRATAIEGYNENILQSVPSGVISFDQDMRITKTNLAAEKILEIRGEEAAGKSHTEVLNKPISDFLKDRMIIERGETAYTTPSGKRIWLGLTLSPLKDKEGTVIGRILVFTDLTHLKAIESQIELRNKLSSLGEISAGIAHELRNPMGVIAGYTKLLSKKADDSLRSTVTAISKEIAVMDRIISDFLSFARPAELSATDIDLKTLMEHCAASALGERKEITFSLEIDNQPLMKGDEVLIRQAFINLFQNAIESMPQGGNISVRVSPSTVSDRAFLDISVSDSGHGISENIRDKIFLPFFTTKEKGTGLGLAIVHKIVVSHGGSISVDSSDKGTTFRIRLPLSQIIHKLFMDRPGTLKP
jgi:PAS domain S-box-containing protein